MWSPSTAVEFHELRNKVRDKTKEISTWDEYFNNVVLKKRKIVAFSFCSVLAWAIVKRNAEQLGPWSVSYLKWNQFGWKFLWNRWQLSFYFKMEFVPYLFACLPHLLAQTRAFALYRRQRRRLGRQACAQWQRLLLEFLSIISWNPSTNAFKLL